MQGGAARRGGGACGPWLRKILPCRTGHNADWKPSRIRSPHERSGAALAVSLLRQDRMESLRDDLVPEVVVVSVILVQVRNVPMLLVGELQQQGFGVQVRDPALFE